LLDEGLADEGVHVIARIEPRPRRGPEGLARAFVGTGLERAHERRQDAERRANGREIARRRAVHHELHGEAFDVADAREVRAYFGAEAGLGHEELHRVEPAANLGHARERREQTPTQEARAGRGLRRVDLREERALRVAVHRAYELEVSLGRLIEDERAL